MTKYKDNQKREKFRYFAIQYYKDLTGREYTITYNQGSNLKQIIISEEKMRDTLDDFIEKIISLNHNYDRKTKRQDERKKAKTQNKK